MSTDLSMLTPPLLIDESHNRPRGNFQRGEEIKDRISRVQFQKRLQNRLVIVIITRHEIDLVLDFQRERRGPEDRENGEEDGVPDLQASP